MEKDQTMTLASRIKLGMAIPKDFPDGRVDMALLKKASQRAEALGFDSLWTNESILGGTPNLDALVVLSYVASVTANVRLGVAVLVFPLHSPVHVARRVASIDQVSGGRVTVGLGLGNPDEPYAAFGLTAERRVRRFEEGVQLMKALWTESTVDHHGEFYDLSGAMMEPKPIQHPHPPVWFGGAHPNALRRSVRMSDAWMGAGASSSADFKARVPQIRQFLEAEGRDPASFTISKRIYIAVDSDEARAERELRRRFGDRASEICVWGSPERCAEQLEDVASVGVDHLLLHPVYALEEQLEALAEVAGLK